MLENLISIISKCKNQEVRLQWIQELKDNTDYECSESQCTGCPIVEECLSLNNTEVDTNE